MLRNQSGNLNYEPHNLQRKTFFTTDSQATVTKSRKISTSSLKENIPDLDKLISDLKIHPNSEIYGKSVSQIFSALQNLKNNPDVEEQVKAVSLFMQTIEKKLSNDTKTKKQKPLSKPMMKKQSLCSQNIKINELSPIKQYDDGTSRILYTNFSIKDLQRERSEEESLSTSKMQGSIKVSRFEEDENALQIKKLNEEIRALEDLLQQKITVKPRKNQIRY